MNSFLEGLVKTAAELYDMQTISPEITELVFFGKTECRVVWSDGIITTVICGKKDTFSEETAVLMAIAKRFMKGYTTVENALRKAERLPSRGRLNKLMDK